MAGDVPESPGVGWALSRVPGFGAMEVAVPPTHGLLTHLTTPKTFMEDLLPLPGSMMGPGRLAR